MLCRAAIKWDRIQIHERLLKNKLLHDSARLRVGRMNVNHINHPEGECALYQYISRAEKRKKSSRVVL